MAENNFYQRLYARGHDYEPTGTVEEEAGQISCATKIVIKDEDLALAYRLLLLMRAALIQCANQFRYYGHQHEQQQGGHLSLVERQQLQLDIDRNLGIAKSIDQIVDSSPELPPQEWRLIATAPQDGSYIRALGKRDDGSVYIETTRWWNIKWAIELMHGYKAPTHWLPLERLPEDYK